MTRTLGRTGTSVTPATVVADVERLLRELSASGQTADAAEMVDVVGFAMVNLVRQEYIIKSRGVADRDGVKWKKLSPRYLAYGRRFGRGEQKALKEAAGLGKANRYGPGDSKGLLTKDQLKQWRAIFAQQVAKLTPRVGADAALGIAAKMAWAFVKSRGARTKLEVYGHRQVEIMRDTGVLLDSIAYSPCNGGVAIGTPIKYAPRLFRMRPAWPLDGNLPPRWVRIVMDAVQDGLCSILKRRLAR